MIKKAVIPAAGFGTRFLPVTKAIPKEMLPVVDKPLIQYGIEEIISSGMDQILIITSRNKSSIEDYFDKNPELEKVLEEKDKRDLLEEVKKVSDLAKIVYIRQKEMMGLGHAVLLAKDFVNNEPFAVLLPDDIIDSEIPCLKQLVEVYSEYSCSVVALERVDEEGTWRYGIIKPRQISDRVFKIEDVIEKPGPERAYSDLAVIGRYVFEPDIFSELERTKPDSRGEIQLTDAFGLLSKKRPVYGLLFEGRRYDVGNKFGFIEANIRLALKRKEFEAKIKEILSSLKY
ncbi:UTP--glucose-1-phosphate uridylyltransferase GalU [SCandidatus Aminicenantes bacterium Aminicenantia_JdfR_composite]|jgi:UTP--glucose-1-phosphate uridylyltransferase|nr:UTP--glucose-1-phosphate uridylyltransferase GalU [SCandidatus Aminicenantes bacterium Aminicenantia_JdfR_composite]MCP2596587.1 UTP--glucose-1-phosphate uridylyltransferase GalU [Candidatus Aminicenantes bacterium AC-335-G13]MCP2598186.1 UTP--glucose-1-phosphate uridylyltransferase GalU [Candidatus Aminicenantes bacterium AC-335-L06]MCP2620985.1 UTP--glucose-1-phosphate uridylyltransferase GalU [Candidatus Aminicenantes bacterium AC-334-E05]